MDTFVGLTNDAIICARAVDAPKYSHSVFGEDFTAFSAECSRRSGRTDVIKCIAPYKLKEYVVPKKLLVYSGQVRSFNKAVEGVSRLIISLFVKSIAEYNEMLDDTLNEITLNGYVCKKPVYRRTPFDREITDMLLAVNRSYGKSDYIPVIVWGINARNAASLDVGSRVRIEGRLQSRDYEKKQGDVMIKRTAYEVSAYSLTVV